MCMKVIGYHRGSIMDLWDWSFEIQKTCLELNLSEKFQGSSGLKFETNMRQRLDKSTEKEYVIGIYYFADNVPMVPEIVYKLVIRLIEKDDALCAICADESDLMITELFKPIKDLFLKGMKNEISE